MKLALNTYRDRICQEEFDFAKQCGCNGMITGLANFNQKWIGGNEDIPLVMANDPIWTYDSLKAISDQIHRAGLKWYAIENFDPADWYDVLLDGPEKVKQMDRLKRLITDVGKVGVESFGYNFSLTAVYGRELGKIARGGATSMYFTAGKEEHNQPIPNGEVWNARYDPSPSPGFVPSIDNEELWQRCKWFLEEILPVAEEAGVKMAAHPDDPPVPRMRGNAKLIYKLDMFQRLVDMVPSPNSCIDLCLGTMQEMDDGEVYPTIASLSKQDKVAYVHLRNVRGKVPHYEEVFLDEGDLDVVKALMTLRDNGFDGPVVPDHVPNMSTKDPWHSSMAYALGYIKAVMQQLGVAE